MHVLIGRNFLNFSSINKAQILTNDNNIDSEVCGTMVVLEGDGVFSRVFPDYLCHGRRGHTIDGIRLHTFFIR